MSHVTVDGLHSLVPALVSRLCCGWLVLTPVSDLYFSSLFFWFVKRLVSLFLFVMAGTLAFSISALVAYSISLPAR